MAYNIWLMAYIHIAYISIFVHVSTQQSAARKNIGIHRQLAERIPINCFKSNPSVKSSLTFLRKTPWARKKVEDLYVEVLKFTEG
jgi:uncharacterized protein (DUF2132 family)